MRAMGRAFEAITALGILGVLFAVGAFFASVWMLASLLGKLGIFQTEADRAANHAAAIATAHQLSEDLRWLPWKTAAIAIVMIALCLAVALLAVGGSLGFLLRRVQDAQLLWPRAGVFPVPRAALWAQREGEPLLGQHTADEYWRTEEANARRSLPPVRQDVHITGASKEEAKEAMEHHEAPSFKVLSANGEYGEAK